MLDGSSRSFGDDFGQPRRPAIGNKKGGRARCMCSSDNGSEIVRILYAVEQHQELDSGPGQDVIKLDIALRGPKRHYTLVGGAVGCAVESVSRFEAYRHRTPPRQIDDFLETGPTRSTGDQNPVERSSGAQSFAYWMNAGQKATGLA
jgi:hypothetical protein